jgi:hypothetical protein
LINRCHAGNELIKTCGTTAEVAGTTITAKALVVTLPILSENCFGLRSTLF